MTSTPPLASATRPQSPRSCQRCGGSGILRLADGRFRTCLDCLGQGLTLTTAGVIPPQTGRISAPPIASIAK